MEFGKMLEVANKEKFRFSFRGQQSVEDLYDLSPSSLDTIYKTLNKEVKLVTEESLLDVKTKANTELNIKIEIVKHICNEKVEARKELLDAQSKKVKKQQLLEILESKQNDELKNKTPKEIQAMIDELG